MVHPTSTFGDVCILGQQNMRIFADLCQRRPKSARNSHAGHVYPENFGKLAELKSSAAFS